MVGLANSCAKPVPPTPAEVASQPIPVQPGEKAGWEVEWEKTLGAAKKERKVVIYFSAGGSTRDALIKGFQDSLGLNAEIVSGSGAQMVQKLLTEKRAGLHAVDIYLGGSTSIFASLKPEGILEYLPPVLVLPEVKDGKYWYKGELSWLDEDKKILATWAYVSGIIIVNANLVNEKELSSAKELLNPKWKGKIIMGNPSMPGSTQSWSEAVLRNMGQDFMKDFVKQEPTITMDDRLKVEWVSRGKYTIGIGAGTEVVSEFIRIRAPLRITVLPEIVYLVGGSANITLMKTAPHPNAAKIFINWLLSREGQLISSKAQGVQSARIDIPPDYLNPTYIRDPNIRYYDISLEKYQKLRPEVMKLAGEIFSPLLK